MQTETNIDRASGTFANVCEGETASLRLGARARGFSLIELLVVAAIILIVAAFAVPNMVTTMDAYRLRSSMNSAMAMTQRARLAAIKQNQTQILQFTNGNQVVLYYKNATSASLALQPIWVGGTPPDAHFWMPTMFTIPGVPAGPTPLTGLIMWNSGVNPNSVNVPIQFNSRGMPVDPTGYLYYFRYTSSNRTRWTALSVSPAGRIESWFWNGNGWGN